MSDVKKSVLKLIVNRDGKDGLDAFIKSIQTRGLKLDRDIQRAAVSAIWWHVTHGDYDAINNLVAAMPAGSRSNALREYFDRFSGCKYDEQKKKFVNDKDKRQCIVDYGLSLWCENINQTAWTALAPEKAYKPLDPMQAFNKLIVSLEKDMETLGENSKVTPLVLEAFKAARAEIMETLH